MKTAKNGYAFVRRHGRRWQCWVPDTATKSGIRWVSSVKGKPFADALAAHNYAIRYRELRQQAEGQEGRFCRLGEAVEEFLADYPEASETRRFYRGHLYSTWIKRWGEKLPLHRVTKDRVKAVIRELAQVQKPGAVQASYRALRAFLRWAQENEYLDHDPLIGIRKVLPKLPYDHEEQQPFLPPERVFQIITTIRNTDRPDAELMGNLVTIYFYTGLRLQGVTRLRRKNIDLDKRILRTESKGRNVVYLDDPELYAAVRWFVENTATLRRFGFDDNGTLTGMSKDAVQYRFKMWKTILDEPNFTAHALKRSYADFHENVGLPLKDLQGVTRHSTATMALRYSRPDEKRVRAAVGSMSASLAAASANGSPPAASHG